MRGAGFIDAGPDATDPRNFTWGASALLAGPDLARVEAARRAGNPYGFTDRLDFVFLRNGARALDAHLIGNTWPDGDDLWACSTPAQATSAAQAATALGVADPATTRCLPTDHAGVVATIALPASTAINPPLPARVSERPLTTTIALIAIVAVAVGVVAHLALALVLIVPLMIVVARQRRRRRS
jgi:hypothetical protein